MPSSSPAPAAVPAPLGRRICTWFIASLLIAVGGEVAARLDDTVYSDVPFFSNPHRENDLTVRDEHGVHGRPYGRFKKWKLNAFGFRSPAIEREKPAGTTRVMVLGASETFGLYENEGKEYVAQLAERFRSQGRTDVEIVNAAMAGISIKSMLPYWKRWVAPLRPDYVVVYPSPLFYLDDKVPQGPSEGPDPDEGDIRLRSRFMERVGDSIRKSEFIRMLRVRYVLATKVPTKGDAYVFADVPMDRLQAYLVDLENLLEAIRESGATPILLTHAAKCPSPPEPRDIADLEAMRLFLLRAEPHVMAAFEGVANRSMRDLAKRRGIALVDVAEHLTGKREIFADLVHFNDAGAGEMADLLAKELAPWLSKKGTP